MGTLSLLRKLIIAACLGVILMLGVWPIAGGVIGQTMRENRLAAEGEAVAAKYREDRFRNVCPLYWDSSFLGKTFGNSHLAWCADYEHRR